MGRAVAAAALAVALFSACAGDGGTSDDAAAEGEASTTTAGSSAVVAADELEFEGDPDSAFCERSREAATRPVQDPFEAGLEPDEVELRFRALASRFRSFAQVAPPPLTEDLAVLVATFDRFAELLEGADYDFGRLAEADVDVSVFDDPELARVAARIAAFQEQVCDQG